MREIICKTEHAFLAFQIKDLAHLYGDDGLTRASADIRAVAH